MREILFRGKSIPSGEWVYGVPVPVEINSYPTGRIELVRSHGYDELDGLSVLSDDDEVHPETVGQYVGFTDIFGKKIFEGDIVKFRHGGEFSYRGMYYRNYVVEFVNTYVTYGIRLRNKSIFFPFKDSTACMHDAKVIGNIYDNPELLEVEVERIH